MINRWDNYPFWYQGGFRFPICAVVFGLLLKTSPSTPWSLPEWILSMDWVSVLHDPHGWAQAKGENPQEAEKGRGIGTLLWLPQASCFPKPKVSAHGSYKEWSLPYPLHAFPVPLQAWLVWASITIILSIPL